MERKIGEIFEYNGEWHQCVESDGTCNGCVGTFQSYSFCNDFEECVGKIFKKLEKVGKPYTDYCPSGRVIYFQRYKCYQKPAISKETIIHWADDISVSIEIKQNKENMEENYKAEDTLLTRLVGRYVNNLIDYETFEEAVKELYSDKKDSKLTLKEFDLKAAKAGKPVCTRDGRKARIICFDQKDIAPIVGLVTGLDGKESIYAFYKDGRVSSQKERVDDLMMLPEKKEGWINIYDADTTFRYVDGRVYETKDEAVQKAKEEIAKELRGKNEYIDTIRVEWEE